MVESRESKRAYDEGYEAFGEYHMLLSENPYTIDEEELRQRWEDGWKMAKEDYYEYLDSNSPLRPEDYSGNY